MRRNFISCDTLEAINSFDIRFKIGDVVTHQTAGKATITSFEINKEMNEVKVHTTKGYTHIDFIDLE